MRIYGNRLVVYLGPFSFPNGGAAARRILGNAQAIRDAGYTVLIASGQSADDGAISSVFEGFEVLSLGERNAEHLPRLLKHFSYVNMGAKTLAWLDSLSHPPYAVVLYSGYSPYLLRLIPWAKRNGVRLVFDAVEWYQPDSTPGYLSPYQLNIEFAMRTLLPRVPNIISISSYLHNHYAARGCHSLIVPPLLDTAKTAHRETGRDPSQPLNLVYAGTPGKKDLLDNIMNAVLQLRLKGLNLRLTVAGIAPTASARYRSIQHAAPSLVENTIQFAGILSHDASLDLVRGADFSLLLRQDARYAMAGFPTKFVESLTVGTPVIANLTSDLAQHLRDGETGFVCAGPSAGDLMAGLSSAAALSTESHSAMRRACRSQAQHAFDYRKFTESISSFFSTAKV